MPSGYHQLHACTPLDFTRSSFPVEPVHAIRPGLCTSSPMLFAKPLTRQVGSETGFHLFSYLPSKTRTRKTISGEKGGTPQKADNTEFNSTPLNYSTSEKGVSICKDMLQKGGIVSEYKLFKERLRAVFCGWWRTWK
jgi:hypothetical protein